MRLSPYLLGLSLLALAAGTAQAQTVTTITPDAGNPFDTGSIVTIGGNTHTITGGELSGGNLFHSFTQFDLAQIDIATWTANAANTASISNVISRVTGGSASNIDGTINSTNLSNANFYFINPAGIIFGGAANINVPNSVYFSTAEEIRFSSGTAFSTVTPDGSTFSSAPPEDFGFFGAQQNIEVSAGINIQTGLRSTSLIGGDISLQGNIFSQGADLGLVAVGSGVAEVSIADSFSAIGNGQIELSRLSNIFGSNIDLAASTILLDSANIVLTGNGGGNITRGLSVQVNNLVIDNGVISTEANGGNASGAIDINATNRLMLTNNAQITSRTIGPGNSGSIVINVDELLMSSSAISSNTTSAGSAGNISIGVTSLLNIDKSDIRSETFNAGDAGSIAVAAGDIVNEGGNITSLTSGEGDAGSVSVSATNLAMSGGALNVAGSRIGSSTNSTGNAGNVAVIASSLSLIEGASIDSRTFSSADDGGDAGGVSVTATDTLFLADFGEISAATSGSGKAGSVDIIASNLQMTGGTITSSTRGSGMGGNVKVTADTADLSGFASIRASVLFPGSTGDAGIVTVDVADSLNLTDRAAISASTDGVGNAGSVNVKTQSLAMVGGQISSASQIVGNAGTVNVTVSDLTVTDGLIGSSTLGIGNAGNVNIVADNFTVNGGSSINSQTTSLASDAGDAGSVTITIADTFSVNDFAGISASTAGSGNAGSVRVVANGLQMSGGQISSSTTNTGDAGSVDIVAQELALPEGQIISSTSGAGNAGDVTINAANAALDFNASINSNTSAAGKAGQVLVNITNDLSLSQLSEISASTTNTGDAGNVTVNARNLSFKDIGKISSSTSGRIANVDSGNAGTVTVRVTDNLQMSGGQITSFTQNNGDAGTVNVSAQNAFLGVGATIDSVSNDALPIPADNPAIANGNAGQVVIAIANSLEVAEGARISAATSGPGNAGSVNIAATSLNLNGGAITSFTVGSGDAGTVGIQATNLNISGGQINSSTSSSGNAGNVTLAVADGLDMSNDAVVSTSTAGSGNAGNVIVTADTVNLTASSIRSISSGDSAAGAISVSGHTIQIQDGSSITTNSANGPAGNINLSLPDDGFLLLAGSLPGVITTSSGANTGGIIKISNPFLILSDGGNILALGEQGGANVIIRSQFFIRSADRLNLLSVDGSLTLDSQIGDQITGTEAIDIPFLDASGILSGQCAGARSSGQISRFIRQITGPYSPVLFEEIETESVPLAFRKTLEPCS